MAACNSNPSSQSWHLIHTKPKLEQVALVSLGRQGYKCYLPQILIERIRHRKAEVFTETMFPRYLLARLDQSEKGKSWSPIRSTLGVSQIVYFGANAAKVNDSQIALIQQHEQEMPTEAPFQVGDLATITDGSLAGLEAIFQTTDSELRAFVLPEILSRPVSMHIEVGRLRKMG